MQPCRRFQMPTQECRHIKLPEINQFVNPYPMTQQQLPFQSFQQQYYAYPPVMMPPKMQGQPVMRNNTGMIRNMSMQPQQRHSNNIMYSYPPQRNNNDTQSRES
eukprot:scaffold195666_cov36-Cyclotella_meneghiniana.AAC.2